MEHDAEASSDSLDQYSGFKTWLRANKLLEIAANFGLELARLFGTAFFRKKALDAVLAEVFPSLIDSGPRETGIQGCLNDRLAVDLHRPNRLIFELNQIVRIEELVLGKQWIADFFRVAIEDAGGAQGLNFFPVGWHRVKECKVNYTA